MVHNKQLPSKIKKVLPTQEAQTLYRVTYNEQTKLKKAAKEAHEVALKAVVNGGYVLTDAGTYAKVAGNFSLEAEISKMDPDQNLVFGWASVVEKNNTPVTDHQGDQIDPSDLEKAVYDYVLVSREAGEMHETIGIGKMVESIVFTLEKQEALGLAPGTLPVGWWVGYKVEPDVFGKIKDGTYKMFSIGGQGVRTEI